MTTFKLLYSSASPYSSKVRMAARAAGIDLALIPVETSKAPSELASANPLGKIPVLLVEGGTPILDSRAITQYLNRISGGRLFPAEHAARTEAEVLEALADGICDALLAHAYERRYRPENLVHQPWLQKQWGKVSATLHQLDQSPPPLADLNAGKIALRTTLGYLNLRFNGQWEAEAPRLVSWAAEFDRKFPELRDCIPS